MSNIMDKYQVDFRRLHDKILSKTSNTYTLDLKKLGSHEYEPNKIFDYYSIVSNNAENDVASFLRLLIHFIKLHENYYKNMEISVNNEKTSVYNLIETPNNAEYNIMYALKEHIINSNNNPKVTLNDILKSFINESDFVSSDGYYRSAFVMLNICPVAYDISNRKYFSYQPNTIEPIYDKITIHKNQPLMCFLWSTDKQPFILLIPNAEKISKIHVPASSSSKRSNKTKKTSNKVSSLSNSSHKTKKNINSNTRKLSRPMKTSSSEIKDYAGVFRQKKLSKTLKKEYIRKSKIIREQLKKKGIDRTLEDIISTTFKNKGSYRKTKEQFIEEAANADAAQKQANQKATDAAQKQANQKATDAAQKQSTNINSID